MLRQNTELHTELFDVDIKEEKIKPIPIKKVKFKKITKPVKDEEEDFIEEDPEEDKEEESEEDDQQEADTDELSERLKRKNPDEKDGSIYRSNMEFSDLQSIYRGATEIGIYTPGISEDGNQYSPQDDISENNSTYKGNLNLEIDPSNENSSNSEMQTTQNDFFTEQNSQSQTMYNSGNSMPDIDQIAESAIGIASQYSQSGHTHNSTYEELDAIGEVIVEAANNISKITGYGGMSDGHSCAACASAYVADAMGDTGVLRAIGGDKKLMENIGALINI